jgi:hypothetical protein
MKTCFKCDRQLDIEEFYRHPQMGDGRLNKCKKCTKADVQQNYARHREQFQEYDKQRQREDFTRIFGHRYDGILERVEGRSRKYRVTGSTACTREEFLSWARHPQNFKVFFRLWIDWRRSGYTRRLTPSIDRVNGLGTYSLDNLQWLTVSANSSKGNREFAS